jgi:4-hydroxybenzoyl-CoA reductase beta subunit
MRLPQFEYLEPKRIEDALDYLKTYGDSCRILGGGTDLLVRMKQRLCQPAYLLSLKSLDVLEDIRQSNGEVVIGARTSLAAVMASPFVRKEFPALRQAMESIGAPSIQRHRGTIGGNLCQDTRCLFYNQSASWRSGKAPCHKAGGQTCYARKDSDRCHSTFQSDGATALSVLNAKVAIASSKGSRKIPLADLYSTIGEHPLTLEPDEILTEIHIPISEAGSSSAYKRLSFRSAVDYPIVSVAVFVRTKETAIREARIAVGAMGRAPLIFLQAAGTLKGKSITDARAMDNAVGQCMDLASAFAVDNVGATVDYRGRMVSVLARRAFEEALEQIQRKRKSNEKGTADPERK